MSGINKARQLAMDVAVSPPPVAAVVVVAATQSITVVSSLRTRPSRAVCRKPPVIPVRLDWRATRTVAASGLRRVHPSNPMRAVAGAPALAAVAAENRLSQTRWRDPETWVVVVVADAVA